MNFRVLFLEDEKDLIADLPPVLLEKEGIELVATTDIATALDMFNKQSFDAVLLDIQMLPLPDMNTQRLGYGRETGIEVARIMHSSKPNVPIIALTVVRDQKIQARMKEVGIMHVIQKPEESERIAQTIKNVILSKRRNA